MLSLVDQFLNVVTQTTRASTRKAGMLYRKRLVHLLRLKNCNPRPPDPGKYFSILVLVAKETRRAIWLFVSLFAFDSFPQYSTKSNQKHRNKKPNKKSAPQFCTILVENTRGVQENFVQVYMSTKCGFSVAVHLFRCSIALAAHRNRRNDYVQYSKRLRPEQAG